MDYLKSQSDNVVAVQEEAQDLRQKTVQLQNELNLSVGENERLADELTRQQSLYAELKKMRGRGEEMDMLQQLEQVCYSERGRRPSEFCELRIFPKLPDIFGPFWSIFVIFGHFLNNFGNF